MKELINRLLEAGKLEAETAKELETEAEGLEGKLKSARQESIDRRNKLKDLEGKIEQLADSKGQILEALGVDPDEDFDPSDLADKAKGKTEADRQLELKIKRLEKELEKVANERDETLTQYRDSQKQVALSKALSKHEWIDRDLVEQVITSQIEVTDDGVVMGDGQSLEDGIASFAKEKPHLVKSKGEGGSGYEGPTGQNQKNPFAKDSINRTEQARLMREDPQLAKRLQAQAGG